MSSPYYIPALNAALSYLRKPPLETMPNTQGNLLPYEYEMLNPGYFRLISLQPGHVDEPLVASVSHAPLLAEPPTPYYEALSYTWGGLEFENILRIQGKGILRIGRTLHDALRRLRYPDRSRSLWADAVCINQQDNSEKNHQVALMTQIYNRADKVLVHLGEEDETSDLAMECIEDFERTVSDEDARIVGKLLERPWFSRIWVVQEVARARVAVVICGTYCVAWDCFARWPFRAISRTATWTRQRVAIERGTTSEIPGILNYASGYTPSTGSDSLLQILHENRSALATNPLDKVFGILGLMADITPYEHIIDYSEQTHKVYTAIACQILSDTQSLRLLSAAGLVEGPGSSYGIEQLPSWVPDWSYTKPDVTFGLGKTFMEPFNAGGRSFTLHEGRGKLRVEGIKTAVITKIGNIDTSNRAEERLSEMVESWQELFRDTESSYSRPMVSSSGLNMEVFCETITACPPKTVFTTSYSTYGPKWRLQVSGLKPQVQRRILRVTYNRNFFIARKTDSAFEEHFVMGIGPAALREGDIVAVLLGGPVPYVLRASPDDHATYQLVGECYVHGIMSGEALHHVREDVEAKGCMLPPTSVSRCSGPLETFDLV
ncbi:hypothetical protein DPSP01_005019 [Paraphaeosphaeria sporulosa]